MSRVVRAPALDFDAADLREFESEIVFLAHVVEQGGEVYAPILDRMVMEFETAKQRLRQRDTPRNRARQVLESYTREGGLKAIR